MLEEENARLREQLRLVDQAPQQGHGASKRVRLDEPPKKAVGQQDSQSEGLEYSPTGTGQAEGSAFHGPSSGTAIGSSETVHEETITPSGTFGTNAPPKSGNDTFQPIKNQLLAETVRQREYTPQEHKRRNNLVILCELRLALRLLYSGSLSFRRYFVW